MRPLGLCTEKWRGEAAAASRVRCPARRLGLSSPPDAEIILSSSRRSSGFCVNTWAAKDVPGWTGMQIRLGLDDTSPATSVSNHRSPFCLVGPNKPASRSPSDSVLWPRSL